jgi:hypothetical protein
MTLPDGASLRSLLPEGAQPGKRRPRTWLAAA